MRCLESPKPQTLNPPVIKPQTLKPKALDHHSFETLKATAARSLKSSLSGPRSLRNNPNPETLNPQVLHLNTKPLTCKTLFGTPSSSAFKPQENHHGTPQHPTTTPRNGLSALLPGLLAVAASARPCAAAAKRPRAAALASTPEKNVLRFRVWGSSLRSLGV